MRKGKRVFPACHLWLALAGATGQLSGIPAGILPAETQIKLTIWVKYGRGRDHAGETGGHIPAERREGFGIGTSVRSLMVK